MAGTTTQVLIPYPSATDNNNVPADIQALANRLDAVPGIETLTTAARDALAGAQKWDGRLIYNSTTKTLQRYDSTATAWRDVQTFGMGTHASRPAAATANKGMHWYSTDAFAWFWSDGTAWTALFEVTVLTTTQRDGLVAGGLWTGRLIYNSTTVQHEYYTGSAWTALGGGGTYYSRFLGGN